MYKAGTNILPVQVTDISGNAILGIASGWTVNGKVASTDIISGTVQEISGGFYHVSVVLPKGQGHVQITHSDPTYFVTGTYDLNVLNHNDDEIYGRLIVNNATSTPITPATRYSVYTLNVIDKDAITETVSVPSRFLPLDTWSNFTLEVYPSAKLLNPTAAAISASLSSVSVVDVSAGILDLVFIPASSVIPSGVSSVQLYGHVQAHEISGYRKTLIQLNITSSRDFNENA